jgi:hypothetical protein
VSPVLDLTNNTEASVFFDASYAKRINGCEKLRVLASTDCGATYTDILFDQIGSQLAMTDSEDSWKPVLSSDWKNNFLNLQNYVGQANVRIAFVAVNGNGNNLYLDNIDFFADNSPNQLKVESPYAVYGGTGQTSYATGDIVYASATNTLSKLTAGSDGNVLTLASGVPSWAAPTGASTGKAIAMALVFGS